MKLIECVPNFSEGRDPNFINTLKSSTKMLIPVFVHSHHIHQHKENEKFGIKRPIHIDHIVCF